MQELFSFYCLYLPNKGSMHIDNMLTARFVESGFLGGFFGAWSNQFHDSSAVNISTSQQLTPKYFRMINSSKSQRNKR